MLRIGATSGSLSSAALTSALGEAWYMFPFDLCRAIISPMQRASTPMSISTRLKSFLDETQIPYSVITRTTAYTAQGAAATMQISIWVCWVNLVIHRSALYAAGPTLFEG